MGVRMSENQCGVKMNVHEKRVRTCEVRVCEVRMCEVRVCEVRVCEMRMCEMRVCVLTSETAAVCCNQYSINGVSATL